MRKYCLTYDARNSKLYKPDELKLKIASALILGGAENLKSQTASTITFESPKEMNIVKWNALIIEELYQDIFYYLCLVAYNDKSGNFDRSERDIDLMMRFKKLLEAL